MVGELGASEIHDLAFLYPLSSTYQVYAYILDLGAGLQSVGWYCFQEQRCQICNPLNPLTVYQQELTESPCLKVSISIGVTGLTGML